MPSKLIQPLLRKLSATDMRRHYSFYALFTSINIDAAGQLKYDKQLKVLVHPNI
jgi:hypothetical protein